MQTLKKGTGQRGWSKKVVCTGKGKGNGNGGCGAELLVEQDDVFRTESHCRDETNAFSTIRCQECGVLTDIDVPGAVFSGLSYVSAWCKSRGLTWTGGGILPLPSRGE